MNPTFRPLSPSIGVEIYGIDLNHTSIDDINALKQAWLDHHVVLLRGKRISEAALIRFGRQFGEVEMARRRSPLASHPEIMVISNIRENGEQLGSLPDGELYWHYDRVHQPVPNRAGILQAIQIPARGGETRFVNMCRVYESLADEVKQKLQGLTALNTYQYGQTRAEDKQLSEASPSAVHPVVRTLPETGEKALFINRLMTDRILELPETEGRDLLNYLFEQSERSEHIYEHTWRVDDVLIWDNRCVIHARNDFTNDEPRLLKRITVADKQPPVP